MKAKLKFIICLIYCVFLYNVLYSQIVHSIETKAGLSLVAIRDKGMSPIIYSGSGFSTALSYTRKSDFSKSIIELNFEQSLLNNQFANSCLYMSAYILNYTIFKSFDDDEFSIALGFANNNYLDFYDNKGFSNYSERSNYFTNFGPVAYFISHSRYLSKNLVLRFILIFKLLASIFVHPMFPMLLRDIPIRIIQIFKLC